MFLLSYLLINFFKHVTFVGCFEIALQAILRGDRIPRKQFFFLSTRGFFEKNLNLSNMHETVSHRIFVQVHS